MASEDQREDILELDQEVLSADEDDPGDSAPLEPDVLLLDTPAPVPATAPMAFTITPPPQAGRMPNPSFGSLANDWPRADDAGPAPAVEIRSAFWPSASETSENDMTPPGVLEPTNASFAAAAEEDLPTTHLDELLLLARLSAEAFGADEARSRKSLYATLARAYELSLAAIQDVEGYIRLLQDAGLRMQDRAPMTPILKLVFGANYDKSRLTEYAAVLAYGHRKLVPPDAFARFLADAEGGLRGIVHLERLMRNGDPDKEATPRIAPRAAVARRLRRLEGRSLDEFGSGDDEFTLVIARRSGDGSISALAEVPRDVALLERAARRLFAEQRKTRPA